MNDSEQAYEAPYIEDYFSDNTQGRDEYRYARESVHTSQSKRGRRGARKHDGLGRLFQMAQNLTKADLDVHLKRLGLPDDEPDMMPVVRDGMFSRVGELLQLFGQVEWALRPRTFCILRVLGCQELMDSFVALKTTDASLPYSAKNLPNAIKGEKRSRFLKLQKFVLSNPDLGHLEKDGGTHLNFPVVADGYFSSIKLLGQGGTGIVDDVYGPLTLKRFARKRIHRGNSALADQKALDFFLNELTILKRASHRHLVKLVSSYTDPTYVAIIMRPVADEHLRDYLQRPLDGPTDRNARKQCIRTFFGCLAKALEYLHMNGIQHKDIKPANILVKRNDVYLTDFGTAKAHGESSRSNSTGPVRGYTPKYVAPEIWVYDPHGKPSDIWSMGCVFLEMVTVLHDRTLGDIEAFYLEHGSKYGPYHLNHVATAEWISELLQVSPALDFEPLTWIREMLEAQPAARPTISQVVASILDAQTEHRFFCFACNELSQEDASSKTSEVLTGTMLQGMLQKSYGTDNTHDDSEETVTAQFLEDAGVVRCVKSGEVPFVESKDQTPIDDEPVVQMAKHVAQAGDSEQLPPADAISSEETPGSDDTAADLVKTNIDTVEKSAESPRPALKISPRKGDDSRPAKQVTFTANVNPLGQESHQQSRAERFSGLHNDRRPLPAEPEFEAVDIDDQPILAPEPLRPPPVRLEDCYPLPQASFVPSYVLAGSNRFTMNEVRSTDPTLGRFNLFVYGRLMFPSAVRGFAAHSIKGVYSPMHQRRLAPSTQDWARANLSIKHAAEIMTPAVLQGFDVWRPSQCEFAALQDASLSRAIIANRDSRQLRSLSEGPPGKVTGFLLMGLTEEALRYCDLVFCSDRQTLHQGRATSRDGKDSEERRYTNVNANPLFERRRVAADIQLTTGHVRSVPALTYVWQGGLERLWHPWRPESFVRGPGLSSLSNIGLQEWTQEEAALAQTMKLNYALVGDEVCATVLSGDLPRLKELLYDRADIDGHCRKYGTPLQAAVVRGNEEMVQFLLEYGANPSKSGGRYGTPLIAATIGSKKAITRILLRNRADVFATDKQHVNALYQAVGHGDWAVAEMLLEAGAWLIEDYGEIKDLAFETRDKDLQSLLRQYDIRDAQMSAIEAAKSATQIDNRKRGKNIALLSTSSHVLKLVLKKVLVLSSEPGSWRGRKGVAVTRTALAAGAPPTIIKHIRSAMDPVSKLIDTLKEADKRREEAEERGAYESGKIEELGSDVDANDLERQNPQINIIQAGDPDRTDNQDSQSLSLSRSSSSSSRSSQARSPIDPVPTFKPEANTPTSPSPNNPNMNGQHTPSTLQDMHSPSAKNAPIRHHSVVAGAKSVNLIDTHETPASLRLDSPRSPQFLNLPDTHRPRARSLDSPQSPQVVHGRQYAPYLTQGYIQSPDGRGSVGVPPTTYRPHAAGLITSWDLGHLYLMRISAAAADMKLRICHHPTSADVDPTRRDTDAAQSVTAWAGTGRSGWTGTTGDRQKKYLVGLVLVADCLNFEDATDVVSQPALRLYTRRSEQRDETHSVTASTNSRLTSTFIQQSFKFPPFFHRLDVLDSDLRGAVDSDIGINSAALLKINNGSTAQPLRSTGAQGRTSLREDNSPEVAQRNETTILLEVLHDPLSILTAQDRSTGRAESLADALAGADVGELDRALGGRGRGDVDLDDVARADGEVAEVSR
ncbi:hypothetical protein OPT61_g6867 [Boeremia exigua]|uniref:Uncharacterized protein n=1 Tax=Boeremia exigua TaxID=749465 RepID=A0ACC2I4N8_9PLEO|nr:hypothetical protein OPT61_g6867 [Boeremia exigua]